MEAAPAERSETDRVFLVVVDETREWRAALRFACRRALHTGGRVALFTTSEPVDFQHWIAVEQAMREERWEEAENRLRAIGEEVLAITGRLPVIHIREGHPVEELLGLLTSDRAISVLVLAASTEGGDPGPLIRDLTSRRLGTLRLPMTIVPGHLSDTEIDAIA